MKLFRDWITLPAPPALEAGEVHLWRVRVPDAGGLPSGWSGLLTPEERERVARKRISVDGRRTLTSRACLRLLLGGYLKLPPQEIALSVTAGGKPTAAGVAASARLEFNVSHSGDWVLLGFSRELAVGVDVEQHRELEFDDLVKGFFSPAERAEWAAVSPDSRREAFFATWTRKEAYLKALGVGLAKSLDSFTVTVGVSPAPQLVWCADVPQAAQRWLVASVEPATDYSAAIAVTSAARCLRTFSFHPPTHAPGALP